MNEALETVYGENTVKKMLSGKSISRALRGIFLVEKALSIELQDQVLASQVISKEDVDCIQDEIKKTDKE